MDYKIFDLHAAMYGAKVVTRNGLNVKVIRCDLQNPTYPVLAIYTDVDEKKIKIRKGKEWAIQCTITGKYIDDGKQPSHLDIFMEVDENGNYIYE